MLGPIENNVLGIYLMHVHMPDLYYNIHLYTNAKQKKEKKKTYLNVTRFEPVSFEILNLDVLCYIYLTLLLRQIFCKPFPSELVSRKANCTMRKQLYLQQPSHRHVQASR